MRKGEFIVVEGLNGSGKGNVLSFLTEYLSDLSRERTILRTREPNGLIDDNGEKAREILKRDGDPYENALEALGYMSGNRMNHIMFFRPLLKKGIDVLCDRYYHSTFAYQNIQGIEYERIAHFNQKAIRPDLTLILNTTPEESARRLAGRDGDSKGRKFDSNLEFNRKVFHNYLELGEVLPKVMNDNSIVYVNGMQSPEEVRQEAKGIYDSKFL